MRRNARFSRENRSAENVLADRIYFIASVRIYSFGYGLGSMMPDS